jgi:hypothetical protein
VLIGWVGVDRDGCCCGGQSTLPCPTQGGAKVSELQHPRVRASTSLCAYDDALMSASHRLARPAGC